MTGFEAWSSGVVSDQSVNGAVTRAHFEILF